MSLKGGKKSQSLSKTIIIIIISHLRSYYHIYLPTPLGQDMTHGQFLSGV